MLPKSLFALMTSTLASLAAASSAPTCVSSSSGYPTGQVNYLYNNFCQELANNNFLSDVAVYGLPIISFSFTASGAAGIGTCDQNNCLSSYKSIVSSCGLANNTIWGTASLDAGCGVYNFTIWDSAQDLGQATTTLIGSTMTTAATIITATSTSSTSPTTTSTSSEPTLIENSIISSTSVSPSTSSSIEPSNISSSVSLPTSVYANSTSASAGATSTARTSESSVVVVSGTATSAEKSTTTKPKVGSTALGTNGAGVLRASGLSLAVFTCIFAVLF